jgi:membrane protease YdiL (CAAX protease family)
MHHLEASFSGKNSVWRYLIMIVAIFAATNSIGAIPIMISIAVRSAADPSVIEKLAADPNNLGALGIEPNSYLLMMIFPFIVGLIMFTLLVKPLNYRSLRAVINGNVKFRWNRFFIAAIVWVVIGALYLIINLKVDPSNFILNNFSRTLIPLILISIFLIPLQASFEEILFRGYLMQGFTVLIRNRLFPLLMTSVVFGLLHVLNPEVKEFGFFSMIPQYVLFGIIFGIITIMDDGIEAAMGAHAANNAFLSIMVTHKSSTLQTPAVYEQMNFQPWAEFGMMLIMGLMIIIILKVIFKWKDFSILFSKVNRDQANSDSVN